MASSTTLYLILPILLYPFMFTSLLPRHPTPLTIAKIRELLSALHCTFTTILCLYCLYHHNTFRLLSPSSTVTTTKQSLANASLPIITLKSPLANAITAYETGYLLADTLFVFYARHIHLLAKGSNLPASDKRGLNTRHLLTHHIPLLCSFILLQLYIFINWERGILIVILLMLQNFSSPFGTLRWYLSVTISEKRRSIMLADGCYIAAYAVCRVWLLCWIVARFASVQGRSVLEGFWSLKWHCQVGVLSMEYVNVRWLFKITRRAGRAFVSRRR